MASLRTVARLKNTMPVAIESPTAATVTDFFRKCCRSVPYILTTHQLDEVVTPAEVRKKIAAKFRQHSNVKNPSAITHLLIKGNEELLLIINHFKQRHHVMTEYVNNMSEPDLIVKKTTETPFMDQFYSSNYTQPKSLV